MRDYMNNELYEWIILLRLNALEEFHREYNIAGEKYKRKYYYYIILLLLSRNNDNRKINARETFLCAQCNSGYFRAALR